MNPYSLRLTCFVSVALIGTIGCQQENSTVSSEGQGHGHEHGHGHDHDHHARPASFTAAVAQLGEIRDEVRSAMEGGSPDDAHHPLHEVGELLQILPEVAADTDLPRDKWDEAKAETDKLFDAFGVIDAAFHKADGDKPAAYAQVAETIDASIANLQALLPLAGEKVIEDDHAAGHDHDHDHDHADEGSHDHGDHDHDDHDHGDHDQGDDDDHDH